MKTIEIYNTEISDYSLAQLKADLENAGGEDVLLKIYSYGGNPLDGFAMANEIQNYGGRVTSLGVGMVASAATIPFLAADNVTMDKDCLLMIHNAWTGLEGDAKTLRQQADVLEKVSNTLANFYADCTQRENRSTISPEDIQNYMNDETYFTANEALGMGFIDSISNSIQKPQQTEIRAKLNNFKSIEKMDNKTLLQKISALFQANNTEMKEVMAAPEEGKMSKDEIEEMVRKLKDEGYDIIRREARDMDREDDIEKGLGFFKNNEEKIDMEDQAVNQMKKMQNQIEALNNELNKVREAKISAAPAATGIQNETSKKWKGISAETKKQLAAIETAMLKVK